MIVCWGNLLFIFVYHITSFRFIGAISFCLCMCNIPVKALGQRDIASSNKIILKCSDDQKINDYVNDIQLCRVKPMLRCVLYNYKITQNDNVFHPHLAEQKVCLLFQRSTIQMLPVDFFKMYSALKYINLSNTGLTDIEDFTFSISTLIELILSGNDLARLSQNTLRGAKNLKVLDLSHNMISFIDPASFIDLQSLVTLNLSYNKLSNGSFSHDAGKTTSINWRMENLQELDLSHNRIMYFVSLPFESFSHMKNLEALYLQYNHIALDYGVFSSNRNLKILDFSYNSNPYFDFNILLSLRKLEKIFINGNDIGYSIDLSDIRSSFPYLMSIAISNNSFTCDTLASIVRKLDKSKIEIVVDDDEFVTNGRNIRGVKCI